MAKISFKKIIFISLVCVISSCHALTKAVIVEHSNDMPNKEVYELAVRHVENIKIAVRETAATACANGDSGNRLTKQRTQEFLATPSSRIFYVRQVKEGKKEFFSILLERKDKNLDGFRFFSFSIWIENEKCVDYVLGVPTIE